MRINLPTSFYSWTTGVCVLLLLAACSTSNPEPVVEPPVTDGPNVPQSRSLTDWTVDPTFDITSLGDAETQAWYRRVKIEIEAEKVKTCLPDGTTPEEYPYFPTSPTIAACSATKHYIGRFFTFYTTSLLTLFRVTGDETLLEEIDRVMEIAYSRLADTDGDGYRNFKRIDVYGLNDFNLKEDGLAHGFIPEIIYVFKKNAAASTPEHNYAAHADSWLEYLRNDFEAKWALQPRARDTEGLPVHRLMHPYIQMLRYTVYMAKLMPQDARYTRLRDAMTAVVLSNFKSDSTPKGEAFVWSHGVRQKESDPQACAAFQMGTYPNQTMTAFMDLALEGYAEFSGDVAMRKLSKTLSESLLNPNEKGFMYKDVGGLRNGSLNAAEPKKTIIDGVCFQEASTGNSDDAPEGNFRSKGSYNVHAWGFLAAFAPDSNTTLENTKIYQVNRDVYGNPYLAQTPIADSVQIPAAMAFSRLYKAGNYTLGN